jgi:hypothetical protein
VLPIDNRASLSAETNSETFLSTSATGAAQRQNFFKTSFLQKQIQKFFFQPVPLLLPNAKTSVG